MSNVRKSSAIAVFLLCVLIGFGLFFVPAFIIRPFRYQSPRALQVAMAVAQHSPLWTLLAAGVALLLALFVWNESSKGQRTVVALGLILVIGAATMSRVDYFEWMFHPMPYPGFVSSSDSKMGESEMVMAVQFGNDARAYPIREMAYHHVVNDTVGNVPIVVTY